MQNMNRRSELCGGNRWEMLILFPDIAHEKVGGNLLKFVQLIMTSYSLSSFFSVSRATFSATEHFVGQPVCVGAILALSDALCSVSGCEECDRLLRAVFGQCDRTPLEKLLMVSFTITGIFCIFPAPSVLGSGLLPYLPLLPKECLQCNSCHSASHQPLSPNPYSQSFHFKRQSVCPW